MLQKTARPFFADGLKRKRVMEAPTTSKLAYGKLAKPGTARYSPFSLADKPIFGGWSFA